jgi:glycosyltransferase involved in cell wall biosynthesis
VMRVGVDLSILRHPPSGTSRYATEVLAALPAALGAEWEVVGFGGFPRARWRNAIRRPVNLAGDLAWWTLGSSVRAAAGRIDAWYSPSNILPLGLPRPKVVTIHDANLFNPHGGYDRGYVKVAAPLFRRSVHAARGVLTDSEFARSAIADRLGLDPSTIAVAYPGIDHTSAAVPLDPDPGLPGHYALFVGRTEPHKNVRLLVEAWNRGVPEDLHLVVAGAAGGDDEAIRGAVARSPAAGRIHLPGAVSEGRLAQLYRDAACFLFPSRMEGFGLPPLEAMRRGVPTAVAKATCLPEVTAGAALLFDPGDPAAVVAAIVDLLSPATADRLRQDGPAVAARYRWDQTAEKIASAIRGAVGRA